MTEPDIDCQDVIKFLEDTLLKNKSERENGDSSLQQELITSFQHVFPIEIQTEVSSNVLLSAAASISTTTTTNITESDDINITFENSHNDFDYLIPTYDFFNGQSEQSWDNNNNVHLNNITDPTSILLSSDVGDETVVVSSDNETKEEKRRKKIKAFLALGLFPCSPAINSSSSSSCSDSLPVTKTNEFPTPSELDLCSEYCVYKIQNQSPIDNDRFPDIELELPFSKDMTSHQDDNNLENNQIKEKENDDERNFYNLKSTNNENKEEEEGSSSNSQNEVLLQQEPWFCGTCKKEIPDKDLEMHLFFHPVSGYPSVSTNEEVYLSIIAEQKYNSIPKILGDLLSNNSIDNEEELPISDSVVEDDESSILETEMDMEPEEEWELESSQSQSSPVYTTSSYSGSTTPPSRTSIVMESTKSSTFIVPKVKPQCNTTTTTNNNNKNYNKNKTLNKNDIKLQEIVERFKKKQKPPPPVIEKIGWSTTPGIKQPVDKSNENAKSPSHSLSSATSISSCSSPAYGSSMDENISPSKKTNDKNRPRVLIPPKKKTMQDKLKVKLKTPKESPRLVKNSTESFKNPKKNSTYVRKYNNNNNDTLKKKDGVNVKGRKAQQNIKQKTKSVQDQATSSSSKTFVNVNKTGMKRRSKSTASTSKTKRPRLSNTDDNQNNAELQKIEINRSTKECELMKAECNREKPRIEILVKSMEATKHVRAKQISDGALIPDILHVFPALKHFPVIKKEFERLQSIDLNRFEQKLREKFERTLLEHRRYYKNGILTGEQCLDNAVEKFKRSVGHNEELFLDILALTFGFSKCGSQLNGALFKCRDKTSGEKVFRGRYPSIDICGELGTENCRITLYCDDARVTTVPNFYQALIVSYSLYWVFSIEYEDIVKPLFEEFDSILQNL